MTFDQAIQLQPQWVQIWLNVLLFGAFILPLTLFIWKKTRLTALVTLAASAISAFGVTWLFDQMGYVKLLGLPHIIFWTPVVFILYRQIKRAGMPVWPKRIMVVIAVTILISLVFDYADVARWLLGERQSFA